MYPPGDFVALRNIQHPQNNLMRVANEGDELYADAVDALGLVVGEDVRPARPMGERPAGNAKRSAWARYALLQGATADEVEDMTRADLRARYGVDPEPADAVEPDAATVVDEPDDVEADGDGVADDS